MANLITLARIALILPFLAVFTTNAGWNMNAALIIFLVAAFSDFLDGAVARARGETSALGAALDPLADKLLIAAALILLSRNGAIAGPHIFAMLAIILREIMISGLREAVAQNNGALPVTKLAKWKTTFQIISVGLLLAATPNGLIGPTMQSVALITLWVAAVLTVWIGAKYAIDATRFLRTR